MASAMLIVAAAVHSVSSAGVVRPALDATYQALAPAFAASRLRRGKPSHLLAPSHPLRTRLCLRHFRSHQTGAGHHRAHLAIGHFPRQILQTRSRAPRRCWRDRRRASRGECAPPRSPPLSISCVERSSTPRMIVLPRSDASTEQSSDDCAVSIEIWFTLRCRPARRGTNIPTAAHE